MSIHLTDSDEDYLTASDGETTEIIASEDEISEIPGRRLQRPQDSVEKNITASEVETQEVPGRRLHEHEEGSGRRFSVDFPDDCNEEIRLLLVGKTGHGKSATGNSILGLEKGHDDAFLEKLSALSVTRHVELKKGIRFGRRIEVVDCPGFCDTQLTDKNLREEILKAIALTIPGFTAIGFVLKPERFSNELVSTVELFIQFFGNNVQKFAFIILTHMDDEKTAKEYLNSGSESLEKLKSLCTGGEIVLIDNGCKGRDQKNKQVRRIIDALDSIAQTNGNTYFSNEMFKEATNFALRFTQAQDAKNANATSDGKNVKENLELFKIRFARDTTETFSGFYKYVSNGTVFRRAFTSLHEGLKTVHCSIM